MCISGTKRAGASSEPPCVFWGEANGACAFPHRIDCRAALRAETACNVAGRGLAADGAGERHVLDAEKKPRIEGGTDSPLAQAAMADALVDRLSPRLVTHRRDTHQYRARSWPPPSPRFMCEHDGGMRRGRQGFVG